MFYKYTTPTILKIFASKVGPLRLKGTAGPGFKFLKNSGKRILRIVIKLKNLRIFCSQKAISNLKRVLFNLNLPFLSG